MGKDAAIATVLLIPSLACLYSLHRAIRTGHISAWLGIFDGYDAYRKTEPRLFWLLFVLVVLQMLIFSIPSIILLMPTETLQQ